MKNGRLRVGFIGLLLGSGFAWLGIDEAHSRRAGTQAQETAVTHFRPVV